MDIIVVKQPDDSFKISPFRIRFGSLRVFKAKEKIVNILINGQKSDLTMRLSESGEAYFMTEIKRISNGNICSLDGYSSPVELGNSAPTSPQKSKNAPDNNIEPIPIKLFDGENDINNNCTITEAKINDISFINETKFSLDNKTEYKDLSSNYENIFDRSELVIRSRKMSYDVFSRDENYYKFRICKGDNFAIDSTTNNKSVSNMKIELSNSWNLISKGKENLEEIFTKNKISKEEFYKDPWKVLNSNNLSIRFENYVYTWKVIAPIIVSKLVFGEDLPSDIISSLTQQKEGLIWKKVNHDAYKIDIKKANKLENTTLNDKSENVNNSESLDKCLEQARKQSVQYKKSYTISNEQIKSLNLKPGKNEISFVVSSRYQGTHILTSEIYLWDWDDKIIISDLDGTITRSDVLGQFLPFFNKDWSHKGVVKLYNNIDKNGYKIIYLTARAICQSTQTKSYLRDTLIQNSLKIPLGPMLMSPDGLVSAFKREVIDRTPQSFKIQCLTQIVNLFPADTNPFYAGFGNKHTDAIAYEAVGIRKTKIFIINEKGDITQYNNYYKTSYTNINDMVDNMFPSVKGNNTYFNSLTYFKSNYGNLNLDNVFQ